MLVTISMISIIMYVGFTKSAECTKYTKILSALSMLGNSPARLGPVTVYSSSTEKKAPLQAEVCFRLDLKQEQNLAEPNVIHSELKGPMQNFWRAYEDIVLTIGSPQFFPRKRPRRNTLLVWVLGMPDSSRIEDNNMDSAPS